MCLFVSLCQLSTIKVKKNEETLERYSICVDTAIFIEVKKIRTQNKNTAYVFGFIEEEKQVAYFKAP